MKGATSYKSTKLGILSRSKVVKLEVKGVSRGFEYIQAEFDRQSSIAINTNFILKLHRISFGWIFPD